ncbi:uncharacterized mitochondrial protein AtMg00810-like [Helianthus annuus]|uniref:uncharacterized mitochondrial protein AtMg00810-like n=1 Tax=Helianthus annuus TaxID=4232 RepID=UPI000B8F0F05|nr:uncharacterized mitochondrial protein AtMg00810-like [Helianthus annuus]
MSESPDQMGITPFDQLTVLNGYSCLTRQAGHLVDRNQFSNRHFTIGKVEVLIYVDDVILVGNDANKISETKSFLNKRFSIKDLRNLKYFLGIEVARTEEGMVLSQRKYTLDILEDAGMLGCHPSPMPMEQNLKLGIGEEEDRVDANHYRRLIGRLFYLQATRPDVAYSVSILSQFVANPRQTHLDAALRVLRYLKATTGQGILLPKKGGSNLVAYTDSDWLGCPITRRSRTEYLLLLGGAPVSWKSKKQSVVSQSSAEAEYRAMATTVSEILWMRWLLKDQENNIPIVFFTYCNLVVFCCCWVMYNSIGQIVDGLAQ